jgi:hypothetical protein
VRSEAQLAPPRLIFFTHKSTKLYVQLRQGQLLQWTLPTNPQLLLLPTANASTQMLAGGGTFNPHHTDLL